MDCGDLFRPKKLLYAGEWVIFEKQRKKEGRRYVFRFNMRPTKEEVIPRLRDTILYPARNHEFELAIKRFRKLRDELYKWFRGLLRARDNIAEQVGEYYAIRAFNRRCDDMPLIRCSSTSRDIDAIQAGTSGFAIKTITSFPSMSSSIWSRDFDPDKLSGVVKEISGKKRRSPHASFNQFLVVILNSILTSRYIGKISSMLARKFVKRDRYQGSNKIDIGKEFIRHSGMLTLEGNKEDLLHSFG